MRYLALLIQVNAAFITFVSGTFHFICTDPSVLEQHKIALGNDGDQNLAESYRYLLTQANKAASITEILTVVDKEELPPSGNPHDYLSLARYYWPDATKPDGLPYIRQDGHVNEEIRDAPDYTRLRNMIKYVRDLGFAYYFSGNQTLATKAIDILQTWYIDTNKKMDPNLNFASLVKGQSTGRRTGLIDMSVIGDMLDVIPILETTPEWNPLIQEGLTTWFEEYLSWLHSTPFRDEEQGSLNNHGTFFDYQYLSITQFLGKMDLVMQTVQNVATRRIAAQITSEGVQTHEVSRPNSWYYSIFNLSGLFRLASTASLLGVDLWNYQSPEGGSIRLATDYLIPFALGEKSWPYPDISDTGSTELFAQLLKFAASAYNEPRYSEFSQEIMNISKPRKDYNLLLIR
ncbi:hypothetical protein K7432_001576 [Basidiobolus ranarum]|uniref:Alginate lyase domain-containing protein n=1 Tax=Basidiobolus ranarum TaxID=34480 RepID=A0ABR2X2U1_9FUNG